ncbi:MAG: chemotaxis protein CheW [Proteobacteria bacterium]|nr:chemotaxis protein CheW [Pseudomonadota bacterium]
MSDTLIFEADGRLFGFETGSVYKILETERIYFLPGQSGPVTGIVTLSGVPVTVLDTFSLLSVTPDAAIVEDRDYGTEGADDRPETEFHRIIILSDGAQLLGFDIGSSEISFVWDEQSRAKVGAQADTDETDRPDRQSSPGTLGATEETQATSKENEIKEKIDVRGRPIESIDWLPYFDIAAEILSTESANG